MLATLARGTTTKRWGGATGTRSGGERAAWAAGGAQRRRGPGRGALPWARVGARARASDYRALHDMHMAASRGAWRRMPRPIWLGGEAPTLVHHRIPLCLPHREADEVAGRWGCSNQRAHAPALESIYSCAGLAFSFRTHDLIAGASIALRLAWNGSCLRAAKAASCHTSDVFLVA